MDEYNEIDLEEACTPHLVPPIAGIITGSLCLICSYSRVGSFIMEDTPRLIELAETYPVMGGIVVFLLVIAGTGLAKDDIAIMGIKVLDSLSEDGDSQDS